MGAEHNDGCRQLRAVRFQNANGLRLLAAHEIELAQLRFLRKRRTYLVAQPTDIDDRYAPDQLRVRLHADTFLKLCQSCRRI